MSELQDLRNDNVYYKTKWGTSLAKEEALREQNARLCRQIEGLEATMAYRTEEISQTCPEQMASQRFIFNGMNTRGSLSYQESRKAVLIYRHITPNGAYNYLRLKTHDQNVAFISAVSASGEDLILPDNYVCYAEENRLRTERAFGVIVLHWMTQYVIMYEDAPNPASEVFTLNYQRQQSCSSALGDGFKRWNPRTMRVQPSIAKRAKRDEGQRRLLHELSLARQVIAQKTLENEELLGENEDLRYKLEEEEASTTQ